MSEIRTEAAPEYAVMRSTRIMSWSHAHWTGQHNDRKMTVPNAEKTALDGGAPVVHLVGSGDHKADLKAVHKALKPAKRRDAPLGLELVCSGSRSAFEGLDPVEWRVKVTAFGAAVVDLAQGWFGVDGQVAAVALHLDETTPHAHVIAAPITWELDRRSGKRVPLLDEEGEPVLNEAGRPRFTREGSDRWRWSLSAARWMGGKADLAIHQTEYADGVAHLGMVRGIHGSKARHKPNRQHEAELIALKAEVEAERAALVDERAVVAEERTQIERQQDGIDAHERQVLDWLKVAGANQRALDAGREALAADRLTLATDRETLDRERAEAARDRKSLAADQVALATERDAFVTERKALTTGRANLEADSKELASRWALLAEATTAMAPARAGIERDRADLDARIAAMVEREAEEATDRQGREADEATARAEREAALAQREKALTDAEEAVAARERAVADPEAVVAKAASDAAKAATAAQDAQLGARAAAYQAGLLERQEAVVEKRVEAALVEPRAELAKDRELATERLAALVELLEHARKHVTGSRKRVREDRADEHDRAEVARHDAFLSESARIAKTVPGLGDDVRHAGLAAMQLARAARAQAGL